MIYIQTVIRRTLDVRKLTLIELKAEVRGRSQTGVVDGLFVEVVPGVHVAPKLHK